jgi:hypothetical protein
VAIAQFIIYLGVVQRCHVSVKHISRRKATERMNDGVLIETYRNSGTLSLTGEIVTQLINSTDEIS